MRKGEFFEKIRLISKSGFLASSLLNIGAMENINNNIIKQKLKEIENARKNIGKMIDDCTNEVLSSQYFSNTNNDVQKFSFKIKSNEELINDNNSLYKELNKDLYFNLILNFKLYSNFDNYITLKTFETIYNTFPILKNIYSKYTSLGNYIELADFYSPIKELEHENIEYYNDYNTDLNKHANATYGLTANQDDIERNFKRLFIRSTNFFFTRRYHRWVNKSIDDMPFKSNINTPVKRNIYNSAYIKTHEIWHSSDTIFKFCTNPKYSCSSIEGYMHLLINKLPDNDKFLCQYNNKNNNVFKSVTNDELITALVKFITDKNNKECLKDVIKNNKEIDFIHVQCFKFKDDELEIVINKIYEFLENGTEEDQKELIKAIMVTSNSIIKDDIKTHDSIFLGTELSIKDDIKTKDSIFSNLTRYSRKNCLEFSAENDALSLFADYDRCKKTSKVLAFELAYLEKQFENIKGNKQNIDFNDIRIISDKKKYWMISNIKFDTKMADNFINLLKNNNLKDQNIEIESELSDIQDIKFYKYACLSIQKNELNDNDDTLKKNIKNRIKYFNNEEDVYVNYIMNNINGFSTYIIKLNATKTSQNDKTVSFKLTPSKIENSEIDVISDKIKILLNDFDEYIKNCKECNVVSEGLTPFDNVQLIRIFYRLLTDINISFYKEQNTNIRSNDRLIRMSLYDITENDKNIKDYELDMDTFEHVDKSTIYLYINKKYFKNILNGDETSNNTFKFILKKTKTNEPDKIFYDNKDFNIEKLHENFIQIFPFEQINEEITKEKLNFYCNSIEKHLRKDTTDNKKKTQFTNSTEEYNSILYNLKHISYYFESEVNTFLSNYKQPITGNNILNELYKKPTSETFDKIYDIIELYRNNCTNTYNNIFDIKQLQKDNANNISTTKYLINLDEQFKKNNLFNYNSNLNLHVNEAFFTSINKLHEIVIEKINNNRSDQENIYNEIVKSSNIDIDNNTYKDLNDKLNEILDGSKDLGINFDKYKECNNILNSIKQKYNFEDKKADTNNYDDYDDYDFDYYY